ncbi:hypothetical protein PHMEG_00015329 [Phytophthora megakarya]|uniref:Uncharacterized protein n=1 Tax=Phytophthora megakarya TaxID=4795 RepID=A0A225W217_9STRA|nr:hypothetical protein PHMEG_00015329 [Phytophthora megakarya]
MAFQARRELKKIGWHSKKPTGLSVDFTYLKPGRTKNDTRGEVHPRGRTALAAKKKARRDGSANVARHRSGQTAAAAVETPRSPVQSNRETTVETPHPVSVGVIEDGPDPSQRNLALEFEKAGSSIESAVEFNVASSVVENEDAMDYSSDNAVVCDN